MAMSTQRLPAACTLCMEDFSEARKIPCGHNFCAKCLVRHIKASTSDGTFKCPDCPKKHPMPPSKGIAGIRDAYPPFEPPEEKCSDHQEQSIQFYCRDHDALICGKCVTSKHKKCDFTNLDELTEIQREELNKLLHHMGAYEKDLQQAISSTKEACVALGKDTDKFESEASTHFRALWARLAKEEKHIDARVKELRKLKQENEAMTKEQKDQIVRVRQVRAATFNLLEGTSLEAIKDATERLRAWDELSSRNIPTFSWKSTRLSPGKTTPSEFGKLEIERNRVCEDDKKQMHLSNHSFRLENKNVSGMVTIHGFLVISFFGDNHLRVYEKKGYLVKKILIHSAQGISNIAVIDEMEGGFAEIAITRSRVLRFFTINVTTEMDAIEITSWETEYGPVSLHVDRVKKAVYVPYGIHELHSYKKTDSTTNVLNIENQYHACLVLVDGNSMVLVDDFRSHKIFKVNENGKIAGEIIAEGFLVENIRNAILNHTKTSILAIRYKENVVYEIPLAGGIVRKIIDENEGLNETLAIHMDDEGTLYVAHGTEDEKEVTIFYQYRKQYVKTTNTSASAKLVLNN